MKTTSIVRRATVSVLAIEIFCAICFAGTAVWHEREIRFRALDVTLQGRSDSLIGAVQDAEDPEDRVKVDPAEFSPPPTDVYAVYSPNRQLVGSSLSPGLEVIAQRGDGVRSITAGGHRYRVLEREALRIIDREETGGVGLRRPVTVIYAIRTDRLWHGVMEAVRFDVLLSLGLLCATAILIVYLLRELLKPLSELAEQAASIHASTLQFSPPASALQARELKPLAQALSQTMARLRLAFEAERRFINDAAHELKTAVAVVRSSIQVLSMRTRSVEEYQSGLDRVLSDNRRVEDLVASMLTLAYFEADAQVEPTEIDLGQAIEAVAQGLSTYAESCGISVRSNIESETLVRLTPASVHVLASNLIMNAIQYSFAGSDVLVTVCREASNEPATILKVKDCGAGISPESLPHVFERFFREDPSRSRNTGGVGLGLAICKNIVEKAGGSIQIQSVKGQGTTVTVSFPAA
jgi:signal transduction histidine kinase